MREGWEYKKLNEVCDKGSSNIVINKLTENNGKYPLYGASGLVKNVDFYHQDKEYIGIVKDGAGVGRVNTYPAFSSLVGTMQYIFPKEECLLNYIKYFLIKLDLSHCVSGATIPHIYFKDYGKEVIPIPPLSTQLSIVSELDKINELICLKKEQLSDYDKLVQSLFYEMFGDPFENEKGWEVKKFANLYKLKSGDSLSAKNFVEGKIPVYGGNGISGYHNEYNMDGDYIVIGRVGVYCGNVREVHGKFWLTDNAFQLFYNKEIQHPCFIHYLLDILDLHKYANAAAQPVISNLTLKEVEIIIPPLALQNLFAQRIELIEKQKAEIKSTIADLETLLASRMQYWFD